MIENHNQSVFDLSPSAVYDYDRKSKGGNGVKLIEADVIRNLQDAGCREELIRRFMDCYRDGQIKDGLQLLRQHRSALLDDIHAEERKINCLDYLVYHLEKSDRQS